MITERKRLVREALRRKRPSRSQRWLADQMGVSAPYLSQLLSGKRRGSVDVLLALSRETGLDIHQVA